MTQRNIPLLLQSLQNPALYPHPITEFRLIETHISWVILTGSYAYKIKKPLDLGFLDFSTLEKRHHYCLEELRLNSRLAPEIYIEVVAITGSPAEPQLNGKDPIFEYAVKMRQFDQRCIFDHLLEQQKLTDDHLKQTARMIADFHHRIAPAPKNSEFGSPDAVMKPVRENFSQIQKLSIIEKTEALQSLHHWSEQEFKKHKRLFWQRKREGFIRECHGDLHLANIALVEGNIVPFDGIEFNPSLYWIDVISEVAFLVMDLTDKQHPELALHFLNCYLQYSGDYAGLKLLRFYLVYRAMVRAKVCAIRASQAHDETQRKRAIADYHEYLQLALDYTQTIKPALLIMHGLSGSGKSWLSEQIIKRYTAIRVRSDVERKRLFFFSVPQEAPQLHSGLYNRQVSARTYQRLRYLAGKILAAGYCAIVDATFLQQLQRKQFFKLAEEFGVPLRIIFTDADIAKLRQRIRQRKHEQDNVSDADLEVLQHQLQSHQPLTEDELNRAIKIDTDQKKDLATLWKLLDELKQ